MKKHIASCVAIVALAGVAAGLAVDESSARPAQHRKMRHAREAAGTSGGGQPIISGSTSAVRINSAGEVIAPSAK